ncbi:MAG TPA: hypothetical protein PLN38_09435 [Chitinophagales bacterium]|nr:hypothetical protein [Chitinophagales bacterium]
MIDFLRLRVYNKPIEHFLTNQLLEFSSIVNRSSGEVNDFPMISKLGSFKIIIKGNSFVEISGSLHKHFTDGYNWNDFTFTDVSLAVNKLCETLNLAPIECVISNIEFGVNVELPFNPDEMLNNLICYKYKPFVAMKSKTQSLGYECYFKQYGIKIYNKKKQYLLANNIMRLEVKVFKMQKLPYIKTLEDLLILNKANMLKLELVNVVKDLLIADKKLDMELLKQQERELYLKGVNPEFWQGLHKICRKKYGYEINKFKKLIKFLDSINYQNVLWQLLENTTNKLLIYCNPKELTYLPTILAVKTSNLTC